MSDRSDIFYNALAHIDYYETGNAVWFAVLRESVSTQTELV